MLLIVIAFNTPSHATCFVNCEWKQILRKNVRNIKSIRYIVQYCLEHTFKNTRSVNIAKLRVSLTSTYIVLTFSI